MPSLTTENFFCTARSAFFAGHPANECDGDFFQRFAEGERLSVDVLRGDEAFTFEARVVVLVP